MNVITESKFLTPLIAECIDDDNGIWRIHEPLVYQSVILQGILTIPSPYETDFSSVPHIPIIYELFGDKAHHESVPHDWIYGTHLFPKPVGDSVFLEAMICRNKKRYIRECMYLGVKYGGFSSYAKGPNKFAIQNPLINYDMIKNSFVPCPK